MSLVQIRIRSPLLLKGDNTGISGSAFHQNLFDCTPLLEQELVLYPVRIIRERNSVGKMLGSRTNPEQEGRPIPSDNVGVRGRPGKFRRNLAAPGAILLVNINAVLPKWV
jgi:hypothetical protein